MKILKQILRYLIWIVLALLSGIGYMRIVLGPRGEASTGYLRQFNVYNLALFYVGLAVGSVIALLYILMEVFYLKKKLKNNKKATLIRLLVLLGIAIVIGVIHYTLEKVIDVI